MNVQNYSHIEPTTIQLGADQSAIVLTLDGEPAAYYFSKLDRPGDISGLVNFGAIAASALIFLMVRDENADLLDELMTRVEKSLASFSNLRSLS